MNVIKSFNYTCIIFNSIELEPIYIYRLYDLALLPDSFLMINYNLFLKIPFVLLPIRFIFA